MRYCCQISSLIHFSCCQVHNADVCYHEPVLSQSSLLKVFKLLTWDVAALVIIVFLHVHRRFFPLCAEAKLVDGPGYLALSKHGQGQSVFSTVLFVQLWVVTQALKSQHSFCSLAAFWSLSPTGICTESTLISGEQTCSSKISTCTGVCVMYF